MTVFLVGAGPGDPDLLTLRAHRLLQQADVVVHDRLAAAALAMVPATTECIDVGKRQHHAWDQEAINDLLVELGRRHAIVVRLKGGDPYLFGRGGEEALALQAAGIAVEVVPGVSSALAAPAAAGIPVTHRGVSPAVTIVTGHRREEEADATDWEALAKVPGTLVVLMAVAERAEIARRLQAGGLSADTPVAAIEQATLPGQRVVRGRLDQLAGLEVSAPAVLVIGMVTSLDVRGTPPDPQLRLAAGTQRLHTRSVQRIQGSGTPGHRHDQVDECPLDLAAVAVAPVGVGGDQAQAGQPSLGPDRTVPLDVVIGDGAHRIGIVGSAGPAKRPADVLCVHDRFAEERLARLGALVDQRAEVLHQIRIAAHALTLDPASGEPVEAEPGQHDVAQEPRRRRLRPRDEVREHVVVGPTAAQRRFVPLAVAHAGHIVGHRCPFGPEQRPDVGGRH